MILPLGIRSLVDEVLFVMFDDISKYPVICSEVHDLIDFGFSVFHAMVSQVFCNLRYMR